MGRTLEVSEIQIQCICIWMSVRFYETDCIRPAGCMDSMTYWFRIIMAEVGKGMLKKFQK